MTNKESYITTYEIPNTGFQFDIGSDWHLELNKYVPEEVAKRIEAASRSRVLFWLGDVFDTVDGQDSSREINDLMERLASKYSKVIFTPGNHDLRGRENPWSQFEFPKNVVYPNGPLEVIVQRIEGMNVLAANLFYDMEFLDPRIIGRTKEEVLTFYQTQTNDGRHLLQGDISLFPHMKRVLLENLRPEIDIVATHVCASPSLVAFRVAEKTGEIERLERELSIPFIFNPIEDEKEAGQESRKTTPEEFRDYWNLKSFIMGSNIVGDPKAIYQDGVTFLSGHNHRTYCNFDDPQVVRRKKVYMASWQPKPWEWQGK